MEHVAIEIPCILKNISHRADRSIGLRIDLPELPSDKVVWFVEHLHTNMMMILAPYGVPHDQVEVESLDASFEEQKSPQQRLRSVMYVYWKQQGGKDKLGEFNAWYVSRMEQTIEKWKSLLEDA